MIVMLLLEEGRKELWSHRKLSAEKKKKEKSGTQKYEKCSQSWHRYTPLGILP
jgi:hypothetical protein